MHHFGNDIDVSQSCDHDNSMSPFYMVHIWSSCYSISHKDDMWSVLFLLDSMSDSYCSQFCDVESFCDNVMASQLCDDIKNWKYL